MNQAQQIEQLRLELIHAQQEIETLNSKLLSSNLENLTLKAKIHAYENSSAYNAEIWESPEKSDEMSFQMRMSAMEQKIQHLYHELLYKNQKLLQISKEYSNHKYTFELEEEDTKQQLLEIKGQHQLISRCLKRMNSKQQPPEGSTSPATESGSPASSSSPRLLV